MMSPMRQHIPPIICILNGVAWAFYVHHFNLTYPVILTKYINHRAVAVMQHQHPCHNEPCSRHATSTPVSCQQEGDEEKSLDMPRISNHLPGQLDNHNEFRNTILRPARQMHHSRNSSLPHRSKQRCIVYSW